MLLPSAAIFALLSCGSTGKTHMGVSSSVGSSYGSESDTAAGGTDTAEPQTDGGEADPGDSADESEPEGRSDECSSAEGAEVQGGLSAHFQGWLSGSSYQDHDFLRAELSTGSFGGFASATDCAVLQPVVFVHGNSDQALGGAFGGWSAPLSYFQSQGHRQAELYATTYGPADAAQMSSYHHSKDHVMHTRAFIEAVLEYTGAEKVDVVAHSMGVTLARKAIKGGPAEDPYEGSYDVGEALGERIDSFVAIAGGNLGTPGCILPVGEMCNEVSGFYPGYLGAAGEVEGRSVFLEDLASSVGYEGTHRYSIWTHGDEVITACTALFQNTCELAGQTGEKQFYPPYTHLGVRDQTAEVQYSMAVDHVVLE
jgi:triacylglycerol lipase